MLSRHLGITALLVLNLSGLFYSCKKDSTASTEGESTNGSVVTVKAAGILNGVNLQPSYYNNGNPVIDWALMKQQTKIKTVRIEIEPGFETQAKNWISGAVSNGFAVIATYHKYTVLGSDNVSDLNAAANWWLANYAQLSKAGAFTINLINEWGSHNLSANAYASAYNTAIETVRKVYSGKIIIDIPGWGQETAVAAAAAKGYNGGIKIKDTNYILSAHIYPGAWNQAKNRYVNTSDIDDLISAGVPCMIGEFGNAGGSGANWSAIVDYAKTKGLAVLGWCWNGDGNDMNMVAPSWATNATATAFSLNNYFNVVYDKL
ncbi:glycoside hydrolase family 5 protein [Filimonas effusa]|uniref:Glycoside hydrolase n=1 Tax=Filimonas effusa TaxID=2508721 RepID=A0A4Q1D9V0_9BACT|nr:glycoside hydrolase [Filimonas effusa]RXK85515.1 glycoside hydrolase [Filimonas effusa]